MMYSHLNRKDQSAIAKHHIPSPDLFQIYFCDICLSRNCFDGMEILDL